MGLFGFGRKQQGTAGGGSANVAVHERPESNEERNVEDVAPFTGNEMIYILDRSGSMQVSVEHLLGATNGAFENNRRDPAAAKTPVSVMTFDGLGIDEIRKRESMAAIRPITYEEVKPRGTTPLNDAIGSCIERLLAARQGGKKIIIVFTDGLENASRKYADVRKLRALVQEFQQRGNVIIFLAANLDAQKVGEEIGIPPERSLNTRANGKEGTSNGLKYAIGAATVLGLGYLAYRYLNASNPTQSQTPTPNVDPSAADPNANPTNMPDSSMLGFTDKDRQQSMGGFDDWKKEVDADVGTMDTSAESIFNLPPEVTQQMQSLPDDFDPTKGSLDNPESENAVEAQEEQEEEQQPEDSQDQDAGGNDQEPEATAQEEEQELEEEQPEEQDQGNSNFDTDDGGSNEQDFGGDDSGGNDDSSSSTDSSE